MKLLQKTLLPLALLMPSFAFAETVSNAEAEYMSGSLCTLSQRMAKDYLAIGADIRQEKAQRDLDETVATFEQRFQLLMDYTESHNLNREFKTLADTWLKYRTDVIGKPEKEAAKVLIKDSEQLLKACNQVVAAITKQSGSAVAPLIALSEQETTLAQKIARDYFALYWHVDDANLKSDFQQSVKYFDDNLKKLITANQNSAEIQTLLSKVESQWKFWSTKKQALRYDQENEEWKVITSTNVSTSTVFGLGNAGSTTGTNLDQSWWFNFTNDGSTYTVTYRKLDYIFEFHFQRSTPMALLICSRRVLSCSVPIPRNVGEMLSDSWMRSLSGIFWRSDASITTIPTSLSLRSWRKSFCISSSLFGFRMRVTPASWNPRVNVWVPTTAISIHKPPQIFKCASITSSERPAARPRIIILRLATSQAFRST